MKILIPLALLVACSSPPKTADQKPLGNNGPPPAEAAHDCATDAAALITYTNAPGATDQSPAGTVAVLASGYWIAGDRNGCLDADAHAEVVGLARGLEPKILETNQSCPKPNSRLYSLEVAGKKKLAWDDGGCGTKLHPSVDALLAKIAPLAVAAATPAPAACSGGGQPLVTMRTARAGGGASAVTEIQSDGSWKTATGNGCLSAADLSAVNNLIAATTLAIKSSNQSCPKPANANFTLTVANKGELKWDDGGCGTELDPSVDALIAKVSELTQ